MPDETTVEITIRENGEHDVLEATVTQNGRTIEESTAELQALIDSQQYAERVQRAGMTALTVFERSRSSTEESSESAAGGPIEADT